MKTSTESTRAEPAEACDQGGSAAKVLSGTHADWLLFCYWLRTCMAGRHEARLSWEACLLKHDTTSLPPSPSLSCCCRSPRRRHTTHTRTSTSPSRLATPLCPSPSLPRGHRHHPHSFIHSLLPPSPIHRRLGTAPSSFVWRPVLSLIQRHDIDCRLAFPH